VTTSHDHPNKPATGDELADASHRAEAAGRRTDENARAARSVDCECQARAGAPCGPAGDHLARYLHAYHAGALTKDSLTHVIGELDVIAPRALIQPPSERAAPTGAAKAAGRAAGGPAQRALAPDGQAPGRGDRGTSIAHACGERDLEAGS
jgi:hypothetical protein